MLELRSLDRLFCCEHRTLRDRAGPLSKEDLCRSAHRAPPPSISGRAATQPRALPGSALDISVTRESSRTSGSDGSGCGRAGLVLFTNQPSAHLSREFSGIVRLNAGWATASAARVSPSRATCSAAPRPGPSARRRRPLQLAVEQVIGALGFEEHAEARSALTEPARHPDVQCHSSLLTVVPHE
jgi:hypothetical protein